MKRFLARPVFLLALTAFSQAAQAAQAPATPSPVRPGAGGIIQVALKRATCAVAGSPVEFPSGLQVTNSGNVSLPAGTIIAYVITGGPSGQVKLTKNLDPKGFEFFANANPGGVEAGRACAATIK